MTNPCPTCQRHAALELSEEFDERKGDSMSSDTAITSRDDMIDECRTEVKGTSVGAIDAEYPDSRRNLRAVDSGGLVHEPARAVARGKQLDWSVEYYANRMTAIISGMKRTGAPEGETLAAYMHELRESLGLYKVSFLVDESPTARPADTQPTFLEAAQ